MWVHKDAGQPAVCFYSLWLILSVSSQQASAGREPWQTSRTKPRQGTVWIFSLALCDKATLKGLNSGEPVAYSLWSSFNCYLQWEFSCVLFALQLITGLLWRSGKYSSAAVLFLETFLDLAVWFPYYQPHNKVSTSSRSIWRVRKLLFYKINWKSLWKVCGKHFCCHPWISADEQTLIFGVSCGVTSQSTG